MLARLDETWTATFDAVTFSVRGLKLPEEKEKLDPASQFQARIMKLGIFSEVLLGLYDRFVKERSDEATWKNTVAEIHDWVRSRQGKR